jgi:predicted phosphodiesterase
MSQLKVTKAQLLSALKKNNYVKQHAAAVLGLDEKSIRRWCLKYNVDTEFERKKSVVDYKPLVVAPTAAAIKKSQVPSAGKLERCFVFSDLQIPYHSPQALSIALQRCQDYKPTHCVLIGDYMDYTALLGKAKQRQINLTTEELKSLDLEFLAAGKILNEIERVLPAGCVKYFIKGNHEDRADGILHKPDGEYWRKHIDIDERLSLSKRGWQVIKYNDKVKLGKLNYTHGYYFGTHHAMQHARVYCENVLYGHTHAVQVFTMPTPARELSFWSASIGCLSDVNPEWLRGKPNSWDHAWAEVDYLPDGSFFPHIHRIIKGRCIVDGKLYTA